MGRRKKEIAPARPVVTEKAGEEKGGEEDSNGVQKEGRYSNRREKQEM